MRRFWRSVGRARHRFRRWRRGRPFWGGLFLILGGLQLFLSSQLSLANMEISFGPEGFLQILLPLVLALCGLLVWATPQHRHFYGIIGAVTAVYSLLGLNLGGWFLGMLFGVIGGALAFAWTPLGKPEPGPEQTDERPTAELPEQRVAPEAEPPPADDRPIWDSEPAEEPEQEPRRYLGFVAPVLLLAATLTVPPVASQICLPPLIDCPEETPSPTPTPSPDPDPVPIPIPIPTPTGPPEVPGEPTPTPSVSPSPIPTAEPEPGQPTVAAQPALLTADRLEQQAFRFEGITELPTATGTVRVLAFSFNRSVATNFSLTATVDGQDTTVTADPLTLAGNGDRVLLYTSRFVGQPFGVPVPLELTPDSPAVLLLELVQLPLDVVFTDVNLDLVFTSGAVLTAIGFNLTT